MRCVAILGSTGSIGQSALSVIDAHPEKLRVGALAAGHNVAVMARQAQRYRPRAISMATPDARDEVRSMLSASAEGAAPYTFTSGREGLCEIVTDPAIDIVLCASSGTEALEAVLAAIEHGKAVALANKEVLVMAGDLVMQAARARGVAILPVDSEHNALHQCLHGRSMDEVRRVILTASGGPFRTYAPAALAAVTPADALSHPTWKMGRKITVDSATLMNKGLEVIEAHWLFGMPSTAIDVVIHPQSVVHSLIEMRDGSVIAQLGVTDMRLPIQYAFSYPERWESALPPLDLVKQGTLEFLEPDRDRFPCLRHAYAALESGGSFPVVLNAANEVAVAAFLSEGLPFPGIAAVIGRALDAHVRAGGASPTRIDEVREVDTWARAVSQEFVRGLESGI